VALAALRNRGSIMTSQPDRGRFGAFGKCRRRFAPASAVAA
jgi:hypothetical protein